MAEPAEEAANAQCGRRQSQRPGRKEGRVQWSRRQHIGDQHLIGVKRKQGNAKYSDENKAKP
jgi:hypothetical protein